MSTANLEKNQKTKDTTQQEEPWRRPKRCSGMGGGGNATRTHVKFVACFDFDWHFSLAGLFSRRTLGGSEVGSRTKPGTLALTRSPVGSPVRVFLTLRTHKIVVQEGERKRADRAPGERCPK